MPTPATAQQNDPANPAQSNENWLAKPLTLPCGVELPNRLLKSAMTEGLATPEGYATTRHNTLYQRWALGGVGMLVTGNVMVDKRYLERPGNVIIDASDKHQTARDIALSNWATAATAAGNQAWVQISHPGRQCTRFVASEPVSASAEQLELMGIFGQPRALRAEEIPEIIEAYAYAAKTVKNAGFTGVQIHGAHGYLINQFLSPITNKRQDEWGGSLDNRARLLMRIVQRCREEVGTAYPLAVKLNSSDFQKGGFTLEESQQVAKWLGEAGIDLIEISGGTYEQTEMFDAKMHNAADSTKNREAFFLQYAAAIRSAAGVPLAVTGGFRSRDAMLAALASEELDIIGIARPTCFAPNLGHELINDEIDQLDSPENTLSLGKGWFGPSSNNRSLRTLNIQAAVAWFYRQIIELSEGRSVPRKLSARRALWEHYKEEIRLARARKKALD